MEYIEKTKQWNIAYTQTFKNLKAKRPISQYREVYRQLKQQLDKMGISYVVIPEFTLRGDIHFHGVINVIDKVKYTKNQWKLNDLGHHLLKYIDNQDEWIKYCLKDQEHMLQILKEVGGGAIASDDLDNDYYNKEDYSTASSLSPLAIAETIINSCKQHGEENNLKKQSD